MKQQHQRNTCQSLSGPIDPRPGCQHLPSLHRSSSIHSKNEIERFQCSVRPLHKRRSTLCDVPAAPLPLKILRMEMDVCVCLVFEVSHLTTTVRKVIIETAQLWCHMWPSAAPKARGGFKMSALFSLGWPKSPARLFLCIPIREPYAYLKFAKGQSEKPHVWVRCFSKLHYHIRMSAFNKLASFIYWEVCKRLCHRSSQFGLLEKIEDVVPPFALSRYLRYKPKFRSQARMLQRHFRTPLRDFRCRFSCSSLKSKHQTIVRCVHPLPGLDFKK